MYRHWFDIIVPRDTKIAVLVALAPWAFLVWTFAYLLGAFNEVATVETSSALGTALFFATVNVYAIVAGAMVVRRSQALVEDLQLISGDEIRQELKHRLGAFSTHQISFIVVGSLIAGLAQNMVLQGTIVDVFAEISSSTVALAGAIGTFVTWFVISSIVVVFVFNALTFAEIGKVHLEIDLLQPENHNKLGRAALMPTLALVGTQILYPFLWLGGQVNLAAVVPGFVITLAATIYLFLRTTLPLHRRLQRAKETLIDHLNQRIERVRGARLQVVTSELIELQALLDHRAYLQACQEWPFKLTTIVRWSLYLLIPPLTWVGAALIENLVDVVLL